MPCFSAARRRMMPGALGALVLGEGRRERLDAGVDRLLGRQLHLGHAIERVGARLGLGLAQAGELAQQTHLLLLVAARARQPRLGAPHVDLAHAGGLGLA